MKKKYRKPLAQIERIIPGMDENDLRTQFIKEMIKKEAEREIPLKTLKQ